MPIVALRYSFRLSASTASSWLKPFSKVFSVLE